MHTLDRLLKMFMTGKITRDQFEKYKENRIDIITKDYVDRLEVRKERNEGRKKQK